MTNDMTDLLMLIASRLFPIGTHAAHVGRTENQPTHGAEMQHRLETFAMSLSTVAMICAAACGHSSNANTTANSAGGDLAPPASSVSAPATTDVSADTTQDHHSKFKGALVGAAAGHVLGHHALAGAAVGALVQHERNKHPR